jgi:hypothetical protein
MSEHDEKNLARVDSQPLADHGDLPRPATGPSELIPETAAEALRRWDAGEGVFTAEMGGLGPGYEQCIHIMAFEIIRELLTHEPIDWAKADAGNAEPSYQARQNSEWGRFTNEIERKLLATPLIKNIGSSGAQWGAAQNLAYIVMRKGWAKALAELPDDRKIQVAKHWPRAEALTATGVK